MKEIDKKEIRRRKSKLKRCFKRMYDLEALWSFGMIQDNHGVEVDWMEEVNAVSWYFPNLYNDTALDNESFIDSYSEGLIDMLG